MLLDRGFDTVLFGHTHNASRWSCRPGHVRELGQLAAGHTYVEIDNGKVELKRWESWATR